MALVLYQFPVSHFCEKVRWALDYKGLQYSSRNLIPGFHLKTIKKFSPASSVPVLEHDGRFIQGSAEIISYLDEQFPGKPLTPINPGEAQAALEWERYLDAEVGVHVRRYLYHTLLRHPRLMIDLLASGAPFWGRPLLWLVFPTLVKRMRYYMNINAESAAQSKRRLDAALKRVNETLGENYLVGNHFSRADLSAAALLAPLFMPPQYGLSWPVQLPEPLHSEVEAMKPQLQAVRAIYSKHR